VSSAKSTEWTSIMDLWSENSAADAVPAALVSNVRRATLRQAVFITLEWLVATVLFVFALTVMIRDQGVAAFVWGFAVCWFTAMALDFSHRARRGTWQAAGSSTVDYLALARERLVRRRRALRFQWTLLGLEVLFLAGWQCSALVLQSSGGAAPIEPLHLGFAATVVAGMTVALAAWTRWTQQSIAREADALDRIAAALTEPTVTRR
jgi:hypothetical protein